jgi:hypothetical protein
MTAWNMIVIIAGIVLLFFLCRKEIARRNKARLLLRIIATTLAVVALVCMGLPLTMRDSSIMKSNEVIVITAGANEDSTQHFRKSNNKKMPVLQADDFLAAQTTRYDTVHVFGYGFSVDELKSIHSGTLLYHSSVITNGIVSVNWNRKLKKGEELLVQGVYTNSQSFPVRLLLSGFSTPIDSFVVPAKNTQRFQLRGIPKQNGKAVYTVSALQGKDTLEKNQLPVEVEEPLPLKLMILAASPDFENKFLKNWLSQNGYNVASRTIISTNKFDKASYNSGKISLDRITPSLLDSFDILLSDETALSSLSKSEQENISRQVSQKGMGLLIRGDTIASANAWYNRSFHIYGLTGKQPSQLALSLTQRAHDKLILPVEQPKFIRAQNGMQALVTDSAANIVAGSIAEGRGKLIFTTLQNTYYWLLSGSQTHYYALWTSLLQKAGRTQVPEVLVETSPTLPVAGQAVQIRLSMSGDTLPVVTIGNTRPSFIQNEKVSSQWQSMYWPAQAGWHPPVMSGGRNYQWYVYDKNDWVYVNASNRIQATSLYALQKTGAMGELNIDAPVRVPVPLVYFFVLFIICAGFLWMERKIF